MSEVLTKPATDVVIDVEDAGIDSNDFDDWFCIRRTHEECICGQFESEYMTVMHLILVWEQMDDPNLLQVAATARDHDQNPKVVPYEKSFGKCISYYEMKSNPNIRPHQIRR